MVFGCRPSAARPRPTSAAGTPASTCSTARNRRISRVWWSSLRPSLSLTTASVTAPELGVKLPAIPLVMTSSASSGRSRSGRRPLEPAPAAAPTATRYLPQPAPLASGAAADALAVGDAVGLAAGAEAAHGAHDQGHG